MHNSHSARGKLGLRVFQKTAPGRGNIPGDRTRSLQNRAYVIPFDPATPAQLARRAAFAAAVAAWHALSPPERAEYDARAKRMAISGFNLYLREVLSG